jgi:translocator protein
VRIPIDSSTSYRGRNERPNWLTFIVLVGLALGAGAIGVVFSPARSSEAAVWYASLAKPAWTPPSNWFGPVWTVLYVVMGAAAWMVSRERYHARRLAGMTAYFVQLVLNAAWTPLFFAWKSPGTGLFDSIALWLAILWTTREFAAVRPLAASLLLPYLAWVTFTVSLNFSLWRLNQ